MFMRIHTQLSEFNKNFEVIIMNLKRSAITIEDEKTKDLNSGKEFTTISDLMRKKKDLKNNTNTVHYRRDLDSLG